VENEPEIEREDAKPERRKVERKAKSNWLLDSYRPCGQASWRDFFPCMSLSFAV
jgi:hypothetical protein